MPVYYQLASLDLGMRAGWAEAFRRAGTLRQFACAIALLFALLVAPAGYAAQQRSQFDHLTTGFELTGRHRDLPCEECHANAIFKGTSRECSACHGLGASVRATTKPANHILSTEACDSCHATVAWIPAVNFDH